MAQDRQTGFGGVLGTEGGKEARVLHTRRWRVFYDKNFFTAHFRAAVHLQLPIAVRETTQGCEKYWHSGTCAE